MESGTHNEFGGVADLVLQVRDIHGDVNLRLEPAGIAVPRQLPANIPRIFGREAELAQLGQLVDSTFNPSHAVGVCVVVGTAGVGKTALAVHWAHQVRDKFPDGQLYVDLRGYAPDMPLGTEQALEGFLHALGVSGGSVPAGPAAQAALYRSLVDARRILIVLDNASSAAQVRPLLPGSSTCVALVTSRDSLAGLVSRDGAARLTLDLLPVSDALQLLRHVAGAGRVNTELADAARLARQCARLPLALRVAGERAAADVHATISDIVADLADEHTRLDLRGADDTEDPATAMRAVLSWSYRRLPPQAARMFRVLGLHPTPRVSINAAAALIDMPIPQARRLLRTLVGGHLIEAADRDRYQFHDLLHAYAAEQARTVDSPEDRKNTVRRLLSWYLHTADTADRVLLPLFPRIPLESLALSHGLLEFATREQALGWCEAELENLVAAVRIAANFGEHRLAAQFPRALWSFFDLRKPWADWITAYQAGLASARQVQDQNSEAWILSGLGVAFYDLRQFEKAVAHFTEALAIRRAIKDYVGEAGTLGNLGSTYRRMQKFDMALDCLHKALTFRRQTGDRRGEAGILNRIGSTYRDLGRLAESLEYLYKSLAIRREIEDRHGEGFALHSLAATFEQLNRLDEAILAYRHSLAVRRDISDRIGEAESLNCLGKVLHRGGQADAARTAWRRALVIFTELGAPQAIDVRTQLLREYNVSE